jgi:hypothetical protein
MINGFDKVINYGFDGGAVTYGVKLGGSKTVFIKAGLGGDIPGYEGKYLRIAQRLNERYGCTVICASNPIEMKDQSAIDKDAIDRVSEELGAAERELYFFGHSNGGVKGLELCSLGVTFKRMMLVNMPLMINMFKTKAMISKIQDTGVYMIYGSLDPSVPYIPFFDGKLQNIRASVISGADHNFTGFLFEFIELADALFDD